MLITTPQIATTTATSLATLSTEHITTTITTSKTTSSSSTTLSTEHEITTIATTTSTSSTMPSTEQDTTSTTETTTLTSSAVLSTERTTTGEITTGVPTSSTTQTTEQDTISTTETTISLLSEMQSTEFVIASEIATSMPASSKIKPTEYKTSSETVSTSLMEQPIEDVTTPDVEVVSLLIQSIEPLTLALETISSSQQATTESTSQPTILLTDLPNTLSSMESAVTTTNQLTTTKVPSATSCSQATLAIRESPTYSLLSTPSKEQETIIITTPLTKEYTKSGTTVPQLMRDNTLSVFTEDHLVQSPLLNRLCCCKCCNVNDMSSCITCQANDVNSAKKCAVPIKASTLGALTSSVNTPKTSVNKTTIKMSIDKNVTKTSVNETITVPPFISQYPNQSFYKSNNKEIDLNPDYLTKLIMEDKILLGFSLSDILVDCQYSGVSCSILNDFRTFYNPTMGNCYSFNSGWNTSKSLYTTTITGKIHGNNLFNWIKCATPLPHD